MRLISAGSLVRAQSGPPNLSSVNNEFRLRLAAMPGTEDSLQEAEFSMKIENTALRSSSLKIIGKVN